jgi:DNA (cytosine-5)-methyltransferase 1
MSVWMGNPDGPGRQVRTRNGGNDGETNKSPRGKTTEQNGSWSNFLIAHCSDGKARRFEPGSFPLAHGVPHRVGLLRGYGNAIVAPLAAEFIMAAVESIEGVK